MRTLLTGLNHRTAPVELRERLAIAPGQLAGETLALLRSPGVKEAMILSTCNRVEMLVCREDDDVRLPEYLSRHFSLDINSLKAHLYVFQDAEAAHHVFRVASSLDSMVVGEPQILGQVKESYAVAHSVGAVGPRLERMLQRAFAAAKRVRSETQIGVSPVSVASVAVDLASKIFGSLEGKRVLLVGAGRMGELAARHLMSQGADSLLIANRTHDRAVAMARNFGGHVIPFEDLYERADEADILVSSTGSPEFLIRMAQAREFVRRRRGRPMLLIDIAVPRDIDPDVNRLDGVFLYDIDDLQSVAASNLSDRDGEARRAEAILDEEVARYEQRVEMLDVVPTLVDVQKTAERIRQAELKRHRARLRSFTPEQLEVVEALTHGLMNKFLHLPLQSIKAAARSGDSSAVEVLRAAFHPGPGCLHGVCPDGTEPTLDELAADIPPETVSER